MKVSELCKMVQDSIHSGKYPLEDNQRDLANSIQIILVLPDEHLDAGVRHGEEVVEHGVVEGARVQQVADLDVDGAGRLGGDDEEEGLVGERKYFAFRRIGLRSRISSGSARCSLSPGRSSNRCTWYS